MYLPVAVTGYTLMGTDVAGNILLYGGDHMTLVVKIAVVMEVINLIATYLIAFNPVCQIFEEILNMPRGRKQYIYCFIFQSPIFRIYMEKNRIKNRDCLVRTFDSFSFP